jgi:short-subunit dehydrogenase
MERLAAELRQSLGVDVAVEPLDLARPDGGAELVAKLAARGIAPDILINNAGFGIHEPFVDHDAARLHEMLELNIVALTELSRVFGKQMAKRDSGHILLVASVVSFQPYPLLAAYAASKAYVRSLGEALNVELAPKVGVTVLSPGLMDTGFNAASGFRTPESFRRAVLAPAEVAKIGLDAMFHGRSSVVAGRLNTLMAFTQRFLSRDFAARCALRLSRA